MSWFLVFYLCGNCGDTVFGLKPENIRYEIAMPDQKACEEIMRINSGSECIAKLAKAGSSSYQTTTDQMPVISR